LLHRIFMVKIQLERLNFPNLSLLAGRNRPQIRKISGCQ
jgi:hypothetical protein